MAAVLVRAFLVSTLVCALPAAAQDEQGIIQKRNQVREMRRDALARLYELQPSARYAVEHAAGYGVFSTFGIKIFFGGGTTGSGEVINNRTHRETFMKMVKVQAGLGFGASKDRLIFVFETQQALRDFVQQGWEFGGQANVAAIVADQGGAFAGAVSISPGVYLYKITETGLSAEATLSGTKFFRDTDLY